MLGCGVVGTGVARALISKSESISRRVGRLVRLQRVLVRDLTKRRDLPDLPYTTRPQDILHDPDIHIVVEVMGGEEPAYQYILEAIANGKHVVTANKEVMAKHGPQILRLAAEKGVDVSFEASVGGGIPVIGPFKLDLLANDINHLSAIINGTCNYIITRMSAHGCGFQEALAEAQALGYAEPDPKNDVEGLDAAYKLAILGSLAFHVEVRPEDVYYEGITHLSPSDFRYARELGYAIRLLAIGKVVDNSVELRVHPALVPLNSMLANVDGVFNAVQVEGDLVGRILFYGRGAGSGPTSSAVVADIIDIAQRMGAWRPAPPHFLTGQSRRIRPMSEVWTRYYMRLLAMDRPGVFAMITTILGDLRISLASVIQKEDVLLGDDAKYAEIVLMTHEAHEAAVQEAVRRIAALPVVASVGSLIRVEA